MTSDPEPNTEPFTAEVLARRTIERFGDEAGLQAAMNADHFFEHNENHIAKIWQEASKIIEAVRLVKQGAGGSLNDYVDRGTGSRTDV